MTFQPTPGIVAVDVPAPPRTIEEFAEELNKLTDRFKSTAYTTYTIGMMKREIDALVSSLIVSSGNDLTFAIRQSPDDSLSLDIWAGTRNDPEMPAWARAQITTSPDMDAFVAGVHLGVPYQEKKK